MALKCPCLHVRGLEFPDFGPPNVEGWRSSVLATNEPRMVERRYRLVMVV